MTGGPGVVTSPEAFAAFERLLTLDPPTHAQELDTLRRTRPDLYPQVLALVESDRKADAQNFMEDRPRLPPEAAPDLLSPGQAIGVYRIERRIGAGGMGDVWLGARADGRYQGQVAIKTLHPHLARPGLRERFLREGQILASLSHPNIARLLDAGTAEPGLQYLVLEYVEGERIDHWCDVRALDVPARLRLFLQVCDAVAHAHTHLIVHRDLKPSNILVTADGAVKLLDFGIAKLLETEHALAQATELTRLGGRALTPEYAAPEQVKNEPITTATDVYSLGVVLFGLLSGSRPYGAADSIPSQLEREVLETEPRRLSEAAPAQRRKSLRGDLDNIVAKALKKNPAERYASIPALADDLRRHLNFEPVSARPDAFSYRTRRFLRRHWAGAAAIAAVLLAILAGAAAALWQAQEANAQRLRAERISEFLLSVFREQDPFARPGAEGRTPAQLVAQAAARLDEELAGEPELRAQLQESLAEIQLNLGEPAAGRALLERALAEHRARSGDGEGSAALLIRLARARNLEGDFGEAIKLTRDALAILQSQGAADSADAALVKVHLAYYLDYGKPGNPEARAMIEQAQQTLDAALGPDHPDSISALQRRAAMLEQARDDTAAQPLLREVIARLERSNGADSARLCEPLITLAGLLMRTGQHPQAEAAYARAVDIARRHLGPRGVSLSRALGRLANFYRETQRYEQAEPLFAQARAALPDSARSQQAELLKTHGQLLIEMGRAAEAEPLLRQAFELRRAELGDDNGFTWFFAAVWGEALSALGRYDEAERVQRDALQRIGRIMGPDAYQNSLIAERLALTLHARGHYAEAAAQRRRVLVLSEAKYPGTHPITADRRHALAQELAALGTTSLQVEALGLLDQAIDAFRALSPPSPRLAEALRERGKLRLARGDKAGAREDLRAALEQWQENPGAAAAAIEDAKVLLKRAGG